MHFFNTFVSLAAFTAFLSPAFSAPLAEPNVDTTSVIVKRGVLSAPAQSCYTQVQENCNKIVVQIDAVGSKIDAKVAADIKITLQVIIDLILKLCADLKVIILAGGLTVPDLKACVNICIAIVNLCISVLVKIRACVFVGINIKVFLSVFAALTACIKLLINLCLSVCLGTIGGLSVLQLTLVAHLVVLLNACLAAFLAVAGL